VVGLSRATSTETFRAYFSRFGEVSIAHIAVDKMTGMPKGFGFVMYKDPHVVNPVVTSQKHCLDGKTILVKASNRDPRQTIESSTSTPSQE